MPPLSPTQDTFTHTDANLYHFPRPSAYCGHSVPKSYAHCRCSVPNITVLQGLAHLVIFLVPSLPLVGASITISTPINPGFDGEAVFAMRKPATAQVKAAKEDINEGFPFPKHAKHARRYPPSVTRATRTQWSSANEPAQLV
ncbi:hypothetical protein EDD85DRAFT_958495 [Armillaria nabsnona]|nr:hypothetical protein EDD85DRAFT_958495 [Armillaria nabsnona]